MSNPCGKIPWSWSAPNQTVWFPVLALTIKPGLGLARTVTFLYDQRLVSGWLATSHRLLNLKPAASQPLLVFIFSRNRRRADWFDQLFDYLNWNSTSNGLASRNLGTSFCLTFSYPWNPCRSYNFINMFLKIGFYCDCYIPPINQNPYILIPQIYRTTQVVLKKENLLILRCVLSEFGKWWKIIKNYVQKYIKK